jgi:hypothetical protein
MEFAIAHTNHDPAMGQKATQDKHKRYKEQWKQRLRVTKKPRKIVNQTLVHW